jgi:calcineurin-like phosphoesterase family protein
MILFSHFPTLVSNADDYKKPFKTRILNICGHAHTPNRFSDWGKGMIYHADMEAHDCRPIELDEVIKECKEAWSPEFIRI